ncbi:MAG TPA: LamG domain-containing protein [Puia sp.]|nr:LamG domain-containing protein [Puia sp.]
MKKGLLLYLPFSGNIADSSGNGNPTHSTGSVLTYDEHGYPDQAFGATGNGERVYVTNNGSIKFDTAWSLSFGFMMADNRTEFLMSMVDPATGQGPSFTLGTTLPGVPGLTVGTEDVSLGCEGYGRNDDINVVDTTALTPVPGCWYNAIAIYYKGSISVYINGQLISSKAGQGTASNLCAASQIVIGAWWDGDPLSLNGKLDDIRLYNRVLNPAEIARLACSYQVTSNAQPRTLENR